MEQTTKKQSENEFESLRMCGADRIGIKTTRTETIYNSTTEAIMLTYALMEDDTITIGYQIYYKNGVSSSRRIMPEDGVFASEKDAKLWFIGMVLSRPGWFSAELIESLKKQKKELQQTRLFE